MNGLHVKPAEEGMRVGEENKKTNVPRRMDICDYHYVQTQIKTSPGNYLVDNHI